MIRQAGGDTSPHGTISTGQVLRLVLWFGTLAGLAEVGLLAIQAFVLHRFIFVSRDVVWMAPVADILYLGVLAMILLVVARVQGRPPRLITVVGVLATFSFMVVFFMYSLLHRGAEILLAIGFGVQAARLANRHAVGFHRLVGGSVVWLLATVVGLGGGLHAWMAWREHRALTTIPEARHGAPNILLIILDTVRAIDLSLYGYARETTPSLSRWGEQGVVFDSAFSTAPWTLTSHSSMFTGRWPHELSADWGSPLDASYPTLAEELSRRGYVTGGFAANLLYCTWESGLARGFTHYEDFPISFPQLIKSSSLGRVITSQRWFRRVSGLRQRLARQSAGEINREFLAWLDQAGSRPFFGFLNYLDAHGPYLPRPPFDSLFPPILPLPNRDPDATNVPMTPEETRAAHDAYDRSIAGLDAAIGALLDSLQAREVLDNTLVIITSDHGEEFQEHGLTGHGNNLYGSVLHVPLLILYPGHVPTGVRITTRVSLRNLSATIMGLSGDTSAPFPGRSLARTWDGPGPTDPDTLLFEVDYAPGLPQSVPVSRGNMVATFANDYWYVRNGDGQEEVYDMARDPIQLHDLAGKPEGQVMLPVLRALVDALAPRNRPRQPYYRPGTRRH